MAHGPTGPEGTVVWATVFLLVAKLVLIGVPYFFKWATDALNGKLDMVGLLPVFLLGAVASGDCL